MAFICEVLSAPDAFTGLSHCVQWVEHSSLLPPLTTADRDLILAWSVGIFALVFVVRKIMRFF